LFSRLSKLNPETVSLETIADAGHCPHDEKPEKVASAMLKWLDSFSESPAVAGAETHAEEDTTQVTEDAAL